VGAGGIGCEVMKNLVLMGIGCSPNGSIIVTDMDNVSKPNMTNQVLYQVDDLGRTKTPSAARALRRINPAAQVRALHDKFGSETENIFDSSFFDSISGKKFFPSKYEIAFCVFMAFIQQHYYSRGIFACDQIYCSKIYMLS